jgi:hypothetical protein
MDPIVVYLDRNIFDAFKRGVFEPPSKIKNASDYLLLLRKYINDGRIIVPLAPYVLEETLTVFNANDQTKINKEEKILTSLFNWKIMIKLPQEMLEDAVHSWATYSPLPVAYYQFMANPKDLFNPEPEELARMLGLLKEVRSQYEIFVNDAKQWRKDIQAKLLPLVREERNKLKTSVIREALVPIMTDSLVQRFAPTMLDRTDKENLAVFKCVDLYINHAAAYFLKNILGDEQGNRAIRSRVRGFYIQDFQQITSIPTSPQSLGLNPAFQRGLLL